MARETHRVVAWIHPIEGDDFQIEMDWIGEPSASDIESVILAEGSTVATDYTIHEIH